MSSPLNKYAWVPAAAPDPAVVRTLAAALDIPTAGARFLAGRRIDTPEAARRFLFGESLAPHDPFLFDEMEKAVETVKQALDTNGRILIHGDYDVDGISGTALLYRFLAGATESVFRFVPDRRKDGYGVAERAVDWALEHDISLFIAVDCGTSDGDRIARLEEAGIEVVICDHHELPAEGEVRGVLLNPVREAESYPFAGLCGAGVAFKLAQALERRGVESAQPTSELVDFVALATVGDVAPLVDENRLIVREGLATMNTRRRMGLGALAKAARLDNREITASHIGFTLAPRINAAGRVGNPKAALRILCSEEVAESEALARLLENQNERRRELTDKVRRDVDEQIRRMGDWSEAGGFILAGDDWDEGVLGIAAARVVEDFGRPALLISTAGRVGKGSGRSIPGVHLKQQLDRCREHLARFGGHAQAVGFSIERDRIGAFRDALGAQLRAATTGLPPVPRLAIDGELGLGECTLDLVDFLSQCEPFGNGNEAPVWGISNVTVLPQTRSVGNGHLKLCVGDAEGHAVETIYFNWSPDRPGAMDLHRRNIDIAVTVRRGHYMDRVYPELRVVDVREHGEA